MKMYLENEKRYWLQRQDEILENFQERYQSERKKDTRDLEGYLKKSGRTLEIGCGIWGVIFFLANTDVKMGIDPLMHFFSKTFLKKIYPRKKLQGLHLIQGRGERLPFKPQSFSNVVIDNVLDHCEEPAVVLRESHRLLESEGVLVIRQMFFNHVGKLWWSWRTENGKKDKYHPHMMTVKELEVLLKRAGFEVKKKVFLRKVNLPWYAKWKGLGYYCFVASKRR